MLFQSLSHVSPVWINKVKKALAALKSTELPCLSCQPVASQARMLANRLQSQFSTIFVLGTGGSSLGGQVLAQLAKKKETPRLLFLEDIHPEIFYTTLTAHDPNQTAVVAISKSGETPETLCQLLAIFRHFLSPEQSTHFCILTEERSSPLYTLAETYSLPRIAVPADIGGRFSVLSVTGLFPALIAGVDEAALLRGARTQQERLQEPQSLQALAIAAEGAATQKTPVFLVYDPRLVPLALWHRQLWAESLGKEGRGTTSVFAQGAVDQHSQFQLYLDGPQDKVFTVLSIKQEDVRPLFKTTNPAFSFLERRTMGQLLEVEFQAACDALRSKKFPVRQGTISTFDENTLGGLLAYFLYEVIVTANLLSISPFNQPAVEQLKRKTREILEKDV
jgi:glucose-6-phosphate isomerase